MVFDHCTANTLLSDLALWVGSFFTPGICPHSVDEIEFATVRRTVVILCQISEPLTLEGSIAQ